MDNSEYFKQMRCLYSHGKQDIEDRDIAYMNSIEADIKALNILKKYLQLCPMSDGSIEIILNGDSITFKDEGFYELMRILFHIDCKYMENTKCKHLESLANQGIYWCALGLDVAKCGDCCNHRELESGAWIYSTNSEENEK